MGTRDPVSNPVYSNIYDNSDKFYTLHTPKYIKTSSTSSTWSFLLACMYMYVTTIIIINNSTSVWAIVKSSVLPEQEITKHRGKELSRQMSPWKKNEGRNEKQW